MSFVRNVSVFSLILFSVCLMSGFTAKADARPTSDVVVLKNLSDEDVRAITLKIEDFGRYMAKQLADSQGKQAMSMRELEERMMKYIELKSKQPQEIRSSGSSAWPLVFFLCASGAGILLAGLFAANKLGIFERGREELDRQYNKTLTPGEKFEKSVNKILDK